MNNKAMPLEQVRDWHRDQAEFAKQERYPRKAQRHEKMADAIDVHLSKQLVDSLCKECGGRGYFDRIAGKEECRHCNASQRAMATDEEEAYKAWFRGEQGKPYYGAWGFAKAAWMARASSAPGGPLSGKYGDVLAPFTAMMEHELHANSGKGDRPGWLAMDRKTALLEIFYHLAKLQKATKDNNLSGIREHSADVANMAMMLADVCGALGCLPATIGGMS